MPHGNWLGRSTLHAYLSQFPLSPTMRSESYLDHTSCLRAVARLGVRSFERRREQNAQGGGEADRPHFPTGTWPIPSNPGRIQEVATGSGGSAASGRASRATRSAPISQPSEVGDGLQFVSAASCSRQLQRAPMSGSAPTNTRSLPDANCVAVLVSASRKPLPRPVQRPRPCQSHVQRLPQLRGLYAMLGPNNRAAKDTGRYSRGPAPNLLA